MISVKIALDNVVEFAKQPENCKILEQFNKEVELLCKLVHPNICACYGAITYDTDEELCMWIVMEKLGMDLHKAITSQSLPLGREAPQPFTSIVQGVVSALAYVHSLPKRLVHRDVKPHNIMLSRENVPKLVDFGLAKETLAGQGPRTISRAPKSGWPRSNCERVGAAPQPRTCMLPVWSPASSGPARLPRSSPGGYAPSARATTTLPLRPTLCS